MNLQFDMYMSTCMVNKDASTRVLLIFRFFSFCFEQTTSSGTDEVIDRYLLTWKQVAATEGIDSFFYDMCFLSWERTAALFSELAGCAKGASF
jgi:hypothetical protein